MAGTWDRAGSSGSRSGEHHDAELAYRGGGGARRCRARRGVPQRPGSSTPPGGARILVGSAREALPARRAHEGPCHPPDAPAGPGQPGGRSSPPPTAGRWDHQQAQPPRDHPPQQPPCFPAPRTPAPATSPSSRDMPRHSDTQISRTSHGAQGQPRAGTHPISAYGAGGSAVTIGACVTGRAGKPSLPYLNAAHTSTRTWPCRDSEV